MKAMIFAAGLGTRLQPFTLHHPKALAMVNGKSLLQRNVEYLQQQGITEVMVNVHHFADQIIEAVAQNNGWGSTITISNEADEVLETGGGLQKAGWYFEGESDFVVMNADILTNLPLKHMIAQHLEQQPLATLAVSNRTSSRYFLFNEAQQLCGWQNTATGEMKGPIASMPNAAIATEQKAFSGVQVMHQSIFDYLTQPGKYGLVQVYLTAAGNNERIAYFDHSDYDFIDVGKPESIEKAGKLFK